MNLDDAQKKKVAGWIDEGMKLSDLQKRINTELGLTMTYMEVRLLVDDLKLIPKDPAVAAVKPDVLPPAPPPGASPAPGTAKPALSPVDPRAGGVIGGKVTVGVDTVARPGSMVSGSVTFSDGQRASWYMDQFGRLGVAPEQQGYKPSAADVQTFQVELEKELAKFGY
jgi:hypothetical protein